MSYHSRFPTFIGIEIRIKALEKLAILYGFTKDNTFLFHSLSRLRTIDRIWSIIYLKLYILDLIYGYITSSSDDLILHALNIDKAIRFLGEQRGVKPNYLLIGPAKSISFTTCSCAKCKIMMRIEYPEQMMDSFLETIICEECFTNEVF